MKRLIAPCGLHCIKMNNIGVTIADQVILEDINLHVHCGNLAAVIGRNGAGKSTLIRAILGDIVHTGTIEFKDKEDGNIQKLKIGYVPQTLNVERRTPVSVFDMIASYQSDFPVFLGKRRSVRDEIAETLEIFRAKDLIDKQVCNLSGGELQRVLLSMAVMDEPNLLLLDEPVSGIDQNGMELFYQIVDELKHSYDLAIILISHDLDYVARFADQVILLEKTVLKQGTVRQVYESPEFEKVFGRFNLNTVGASSERNAPAADSKKSPGVLSRSFLSEAGMSAADIEKPHSAAAEGGRAASGGTAGNEESGDVSGPAAYTGFVKDADSAGVSGPAAFAGPVKDEDSGSAPEAGQEDFHFSGKRVRRPNFPVGKRR